jgi:hypothetical protein
MTFAPIQNRLGVQPVGTTVTCVNKSGGTLAIGDLVITSFIHAGAVVNPEQAGNTSYVFNCVRKAVSTETGNTGYLGVVTGLMSGAGGNGREVEVQFGGICQAKVLVNATVGSGTLLGVSTTAGVLTNGVTASGYSVTLMDNAAVADGTAIKRVYIPQEYSFNASESNDGPVVYGSSRASQFFSDLADGTDSLDIVIIGDSNTGSSQAGMWGYHNGFSQAMFELGWLCYGTHYSHLMTDWLVDTNTGGWNSTAYVKQPSGTLFNGNISGGSTAYSAWTPGKGVTTVTISNASPGVVTYTGHGLTAGAPVFLDTTGLLPAGLSATITGIAVLSGGNFTCTAVSQVLAIGQPVTISGTFTSGDISGYSNPTTYYIIAAGSTSTTFQLSATRNGAAVTTTASSGAVGAVFNVSNTGYTYFVNSVLTPDTFTLALSPTGTAINTSSAGSGTHTIQTCPWTRYGSATAKSPAKDSWVYINGAEYWNWYPNVYMTISHPLYDPSLTLWHRVRWGTFNTGSGYFRPATRKYNGTTNVTLATSSVINTNTGNANSFQVSEYSFTPSTPVVGDQIEAGPLAGGTVAGSRGTVGPAALHGNSIYCKRKGWSVTSHGYLAGYDSLMVNQVATTIGPTLQLHLQELRERQLAASATSSGRVLIISHSGINGNETASDWTSSHFSIWNTYKAVWAALGYPANDLAIVSFVGVAKGAVDNSNNGTGGNLTAVRAAANSLAISQPDMTVLDVNKFMPYTRAIVGVGNGRSYYQTTDTTVHLSGGIATAPSTKDTSDGYTVMAHEIIQILLASA